MRADLYSRRASSEVIVGFSGGLGQTTRRHLEPRYTPMRLGAVLESEDTRRGCSFERIVYVDDSGAADTGFVVYGLVDVRPQEWAQGLRTWLDLRKKLVRDYGVPITQELHATKFVNGRSQISVHPPLRYHRKKGVDWKALGRDVMVDCLTAIGDCDAFRIGAVYHITSAKGPAYAVEKYNTYTAFIHDLDGQLAQSRSLGSVVMDGADPHYRDSHRSLKLESRHLIEDPITHDSTISQWTQIADLVAYSAYWSILQPPGKEFGWKWYQDYLAPLDRNGQPRKITPKSARPA